MIKVLSRISRHGVLFVVAKSAVLLAPLLAAKQLSQSGYGQVEWWLALSTAFGPVLAFGAHGLLAYGSVGSSARIHQRTATVYVIQAGVAAIVLAGLLALLGPAWAQDSVAPVLAQSGLVCLQMALSARLKGLGHGAWASLVESGLYICLLGALLLSMAGWRFAWSYAVLIATASAMAVFGLSKAVRLPALRRWRRRNYRGFLLAGMRFVFAGMLIGFFMAAPRGLLGVIDTNAAVGRFALIFRWLSISIVVHQFIMTVFFRSLFADRATHERDRLLAMTVAMVSCASIALVVVIRAGWLGGIGLPQPAATDARLLWLMAAVMVLWSATACCEGNLFRLNAPRAQMLAVTAGLIVFAVVAAASVRFGSDVVLMMILAWLTGFAAMVLMQLRALAIRNASMPRLMMATTLPVAICSILGALS